MRILQTSFARDVFADPAVDDVAELGELALEIGDVDVAVVRRVRECRFETDDV